MAARSKVIGTATHRRAATALIARMKNTPASSACNGGGQWGRSRSMPLAQRTPTCAVVSSPRGIAPIHQSSGPLTAGRPA